MQRTVTWTQDFLKHRVQDMVANDGWHPSDHGLHKHALWTLALDHALSNDLWPCEISVDLRAMRATLTSNE